MVRKLPVSLPCGSLDLLKDFKKREKRERERERGERLVKRRREGRDE